MGLEVSTSDITDLVKEHSTELTTEELLLHQEEQQKNGKEEIASSDEDELDQSTIPTNQIIKAMLNQWQNVSEFVERFHPDKGTTRRATALFNDHCLAHFCQMLKSRQRQLSLDQFLQE